MATPHLSNSMTKLTKDNKPVHSLLLLFSVILLTPGLEFGFIMLYQYLLSFFPCIILTFDQVCVVELLLMRLEPQRIVPKTNE
jgi:hypothetical protein